MSEKREFISKLYDMEFVGGLFASFAEGGSELTFEYFDPDFVWNTAHNGWHFKGSPFQGIQATWDRVFSVGIGRDLDVATYRVEPYEIIDAGPDTVIVLAHYCGNSVRSGKPHRIQVAHLWTLKNGRIKQFKQYTDTYHMMHFDEYDA